ncbi:MAG: prepilin-type N-terminal cleavage/methylation domain-containing protein [Xanthomonadales bacterium]|nr:prepilin-type N-terminal cleavage/methylation domain-containing protein [Xanthomonadales bacterium]
MKNSRGFTLIELVIVVAVIAILAAIALPSYQDSIRKSRRGQAKADLLELVQMLERAYTTDRSYARYDPLPTGFDQSPRDGNARYTVAISGVTATTFTLTATPQGSQASDRCGVLTINQQGLKTSDAPVAECW